MKTLITAAFILACAVSSAQPSQFKLNLPSVYMALPHHMLKLQPAGDGNMLFATTVANAMDDYSLILSKVGTDGTVHWYNEFNYYPRNWEAQACIVLPDSSIMIAGNWISHMIILKLDKAGQVEFSKLYTPSTIYTPNTEVFVPKKFLMKNDSVVILGGSVMGINAATGYLELDTDGNITGNHLYRHRGISTGFGDMLKTDDNHLLFASRINPDPQTPRFSVGLMKVDSAGNVIWSHDYDDGLHCFLNNPTGLSVVDLGSDGIVIASGYGAISLITGTMLIKTDATGKLEWSHLIEPAMRDEELHPAGNSTFIMTSTIWESYPAKQVYMHFDKDGLQLYGRMIEPQSYPLCWGSSSYLENGYLHTATLNGPWKAVMFTRRSLTPSYICDEQPITISSDPKILYDSTGVVLHSTSLQASSISVTRVPYMESTYVQCSLAGTDGYTGLGISLYPNPVVDYLFIDAGFQAEAEILLYDIFGKIVRRTSSPLPERLEVTDLAEGVYSIVISAPGYFRKSVFVKI